MNKIIPNKPTYLKPRIVGNIFADGSYVINEEGAIPKGVKLHKHSAIKNEERRKRVSSKENPAIARVDRHIRDCTDLINDHQTQRHFWKQVRASLLSTNGETGEILIDAALMSFVKFEDAELYSILTNTHAIYSAPQNDDDEMPAAKRMKTQE